jgi:capsid portal protein
VMKKAVEPAYNFYKIESQKVVDKAGIMSGLLIFYVAYTMWWGFAIFYMFDGIGLTMKKAKVKKEV